MKKFVLNYQYLTRIPFGFEHVKGEIKPLACANDLNTLMANIEDFAQKILQVRNPNCLKWRDWKVLRAGSHAEIVVLLESYGEDDGDGIRFIIDEVEFLM